MSGIYEVVKANDHEQAIQLSRYFIGQQAKVISITAVGNSNGTYTVMPEYVVTETKGGNPNANII